MIKYLYVDESNNTMQSDTPPTDCDKALVKDGLLSVFRIRSDQEKVLIEELDAQNVVAWYPLENAEILKDGNGDEYHGR